MGLLEFVKSAGERLFGIGEHSEAAKNAQTEAALTKLVTDLGFGVKGFRVAFDDGAVRVVGEAATQEDREKIVLVLGNVAGVEKVDDAMTVAAPPKPQEPPAVMYTVKSGDTLSKIAKQHYGDANKYPQIFEANKPMLTHPDKIYPGQVLRIPPNAS